MISLLALVVKEEEPHPRKKEKEGNERPHRAAPQPEPGYLRQRQGDNKQREGRLGTSSP